MRSLRTALLALIALSGCTQGGSTATIASTMMASPDPSIAQATPESTPGQTPVTGLSGRITYAISCGVIIDDNHRKWEIKWTGGYAWDVDGREVVVRGPGGNVVAREGDRIGLSGTQGWDAEGKLVAKMDLDRIEPGGDALDLKGRRALVQDWAIQHGLDVEPSYLNGRLGGWWVFRVPDGSEDAKVSELSRLPEVKLVARDAEGSFCMVGAPFTMKSIEFVQAPSASSSAAPSPTGTMP